MWADFLSHFSEISNIDGAENYTVIKQKPADYDMQQSQGHQDMEEMKTDTQSFGAQLSQDLTSSSLMDSDSKPGHNRRISRLDNEQRFQAELDKVQVKKDAPIVDNIVKEEDDEEDDLDQKQDDQKVDLIEKGKDDVDDKETNDEGVKESGGNVVTDNKQE